jgi:hypothetical protein
MQGNFDTEMSELESFAWAQGSCVVNNIFIRGGIDFGVFYRRKDTLISPAMVSAYALEKAAIAPMIAISEAFYRRLADHPDRRAYSPELDPIPRVFRRFDNLPGGSSQIFLDYLPLCLGQLDGAIPADQAAKYRADPGARDQIRADAFLQSCLEWAGYHRDAIRTASAAAREEGVRQKYQWLAQYHNDAVRRFFRRAPAALFLD